MTQRPTKDFGVDCGASQPFTGEPRHTSHQYAPSGHGLYNKRSSSVDDTHAMLVRKMQNMKDAEERTEGKSIKRTPSGALYL